MASIKKIKEITIEVEKVRVISNLKKEHNYCESCGLDSEFIAMSSAIQAFDKTEDYMVQMAKRGLIHLNLNLGNEITVCLRSLAKAGEMP